MMDLDTSGLCSVCNKSNTRLCGRCKSTRYCSKACQQNDCPSHKLLCATFSNFSISSRPTDEHFRAILFSVDEEKPKVIWLRCKWQEDDEEGSFQMPETQKFLGLGACLKHMPIQYNPVLERELSNTIDICYRDAFLTDGSKSNKSIATIIATKPGEYPDWRGPIIAYGNVGQGINPTACRDLDMNDFRHITDFFLSYDYKPTSATHQSVDVKVQAVRINCVGDQKLFNKPHYEAVEITLTDPIFSEHDTSDITKRIGLPIFTRRCPPDPKWANKRGNKIFERGSPFNNPDATFLHLCCDPKAGFDPHSGSLGWAWAPKPWQNSVGSVIVVRQDKKSLLPLHMEALCKYCRYEIRPLLAHSIGEYDPEERMKPDAVLAMICRPTFIIFYYKLLSERDREVEATDVPTPYEM